MMDWSEIRQGGASGDAAAIVVNVPSSDSLLSDLEKRLKAKQGFAIATLNLDHVVKINHQPDFRDAYLHHSHITADGNPIVWLSRLAGHRMQLVPGSELVEPVSALAASLDVPVALLGSTRASLDAAGRALSDHHPGLRIVAKIAPPMGFDPTGKQADAYIDELRSSGARLCFLALGAPKQELFAIHAQTRLPQTGFLSIGAGLDFISGLQTRAPKLVRLFGAEWLWRLAANPRRLAGRYWACTAILPGLIGAALRNRANQKSRV